MQILYFAGKTLSRIIVELLFGIKISGVEHIPKAGPFILATNHISNYDPLLVGSWLKRPIHFLAKKELFANPIFGAIIRRTNALPINRGAIDRKALRICLEVLENGGGLTIFPEGTRSMTKDFLPPKAGIGMVATQARCPIVPGFVHGSNRLKDCLWGREQMSITYQAPIMPEEYADIESGKEGWKEIARLVMQRISLIKDSVTG